MTKVWITFPIAALLTLTGCGMQTNAADGVSQQVCDAMKSAQSAVEQISSKADEKTVGDVQKQLDTVSAKLDEAKANSSGLSQAIIGNLQSSVGSAQKEISTISPDAPLTDLPRGFDGNRTKIKDTFDSVYTQLKCS